MPNIADVSDATFDNDVLKSQQPVLVDFLGRMVWAV
jgi:thioredoxin-like negative regulator of GroEL